MTPKLMWHKIWQNVDIRTQKNAILSKYNAMWYLLTNTRAPVLLNI